MYTGEYRRTALKWPRYVYLCGVSGDYDNRYPIHLAAAEGEVVSVHFLTYAHADISVKDRWG